MASVTDLVLAHLETGETITGMECLEWFKCIRCAARIGELRDVGYNIETEFIKTPSGKRVGRYKLIPPTKTLV